VRAWDAGGLWDMEASDFSLVVDNQYYNFSMQTTGSGEFYPYRDRCQEKDDPQCEVGGILYYTTTIKYTGKNSTVRLLSKFQEQPIFVSILPFNDSTHLYKKDISCVGGNE
jgi:hypothetical protein